MTPLELLHLQAIVDPQGATILATGSERALIAGRDFTPSARLDYVSGPVYLVPPELTFPQPLDARIASAADELARLADANPGSWSPIEWRELLAGELGPVAIAVVDDRVASICHTPRPLTPRAAEAGVWTHPDFRRRGLACATVAAWAALVRAPDRHVFYSADRDNIASQRVAARLGLALLGWTHRLTAPSADASLHPLSSLAASRLPIPPASG